MLALIASFCMYTSFIAPAPASVDAKACCCGDSCKSGCGCCCGAACCK